MTGLVLGDCPVWKNWTTDERCYYLIEDYNTLFDRPEPLVPACQESKGEEKCFSRLSRGKGRLNQAPWVAGKFGPLDALGIGFYRRTTNESHEQVGLATRTAFSLIPSLAWGLVNLSLSIDANLGVTEGLETNAGVGPTLSIGASNIAQVWGSFRARGMAGSTESEDFLGGSLNPEVGLWLCYVEFRLVMPPVIQTGQVYDETIMTFGISGGIP